MNQSALFGVGSPISADFIAGSMMIELKKMSPIEPLTLEYYDRPGPYFLEVIQGYQIIGVIDAVVGGGLKPGELYIIQDLHQLNHSNHGMSSHACGLADVLKLGEALAMLPKVVIIYGIEIGQKPLDYFEPHLSLLAENIMVNFQHQFQILHS